MTGDEIIAQARLNFGEREAATLTDPEFEKWLNDALQELYRTLYLVLPDEELKFFLEESTETLVNGATSIPETWDRIADVRVEGNSITYLLPEHFPRIDSGKYFIPLVPVWTIHTDRIWVRPDDTPEIEVSYLERPSPITQFDTELTKVPHDWHPSLVWLVTSYAYAQEEDLQQAEHYRSRFAATLPQPAEA